MERFKFSLFLIITLALIVLIGYWAFGSLESGADHAYNQEIEELKKENKDLKKQIDTLLSQVGEQEAENQVIEENIVPEVTPQVATTEAFKYQKLIDALQRLVDDKVVMKKGAKGEKVGTIQEFLNIYFNTQNHIDNDYGAKTITAVKKFEEAEKLIITEEIGPNTFKVMISWLKEQ